MAQKTERQVTKRDGRLAPWSPGRIIRAVALAFYAQKSKDQENPDRNSLEARFGLDPETFTIVEQIAALIVEDVEAGFDGGQQFSVDELGKITERAIAKAGEWEVARMYMLYRSKHEEMRTIRHGDTGLQDYIALAKYARYREDLGRRELYEEAAERVRDMHLRRFALKLDQKISDTNILDELGVPEDLRPFAKIGENLGEAINRAFEGVREKRWLPSMRSMQFGGEAIEKANARIFNCSFGHITRIRAFSEAMYLLLAGTGVGFSVQRHHVNQLPAFPVRKSEDDLPVEHYLIEDTIEGWADSLEVLISSYLRSTKVEFNYSALRAKGTHLRTSGGKAPGHLPLKRALIAIEKILDQISGRKMKPIEAYDILMYAARAVLSGGIRRSATIALFSADDQEMASAKTGNWFETNSQRSGSNNSAVLVRNEANEQEFNSLFEKQKEFGEPGFYFSESAEYGTNPCVTADTWVMTSEGAKQVADLIGVQFEARVDGQDYVSSPHGFVETGVKPVLEIQTDRGQKLRLTEQHPVLVLKGRGKNKSKEWIKAGELREKDRIVMHDHGSSTWGESSEREKGYLLGCLLGDGNIQKDGIANLDFWGNERKGMQKTVTQMLKRNVVTGNTGKKKIGSGDTAAYDRCRTSSTGLGGLSLSYGMSSGHKQVTRQIEMASSSFCEGFLSGWFDADGTVVGVRRTGISVRLSSVDATSLLAAQRMLARLGIFSRVYMERAKAGPRMMPDGKGGSKAYECRANHELIIGSVQMLQRFKDRIGFKSPQKAARLKRGIGVLAGTKATYKDGYKVVGISRLDAQPVYDCAIPGVHAFDANGLYVHNCSEISLAPFITVTKEEVETLRFYGHDLPLEVGDTLYGFQMCNLSTINGGRCRSAESFYEACAGAALIGTIQASYTDIPYLGPITRLINEREALLGVSITGIMDSPAILLDPHTLESGALVVRAVNALVAQAIGINRSARLTAVKPEGTTSLLLSTGSGIHPHHAKRYFRRVQANKLEPVYQHFKQYNPHMTESSASNPNDDVITFPIEAPEGAILKDQIGAVEFLKMVKLVQEHWVIAGRGHEKFNPGLHHNVSNTVSVRPEEWEEVRKFLWENKQYFTGVSMLPASGDKIYNQAPREAVTTLADVQKWNQLHYNKVDYTLMQESEDNTNLKDVVACAGGVCELF